MAETALVTEKIQAGEWLIRAADAGKVPLRAALWVYDGEQDKWILALESQPEASLGPREFSAKLHRAANAIKNRGHREAAKYLLLGDVALFTQPYPVAQMLRRSLGTTRSVSRARLDGVVLYRLEPRQKI